MADVFGEVFFPRGGNELVLSFLVFSIAFVMRPLGGMLFGHIGDWKGREVALLLSVVMITASTVCVGLVPSFGK